MLPVLSVGRLAGVTYLCVVITGLVTLAYGPSRLIVDGDAAATLGLLVAHETFFRMTIAAGVGMSLFYLLLAVVLFRLLASHGRVAAATMVLLVVVSVPLSLAATEQQLALLDQIGRQAAPGVTDLVAERLDAHDRFMRLASIFWGLWLAPLGLLMWKSRVVPRFLGVLLMLGCAGYVINFFAPLLLGPEVALPFRRVLSAAGSVGEIGTCLSLLLLGSRATAASTEREA